MHLAHTRGGRRERGARAPDAACGEAPPAERNAHAAARRSAPLRRDDERVGSRRWTRRGGVRGRATRRVGARTPRGERASSRARPWGAPEREAGVAAENRRAQIARSARARAPAAAGGMDRSNARAKGLAKVRGGDVGDKGGMPRGRAARARAPKNRRARSVARRGRARGSAARAPADAPIERLPLRSAMYRAA